MATPYTFSPGTLIESSKVNCNFAASVLTDGSHLSQFMAYCLCSSAPAGAEGQNYYNTTLKKMFFHNGSSFTRLGTVDSCCVAFASPVNCVAVQHCLNNCIVDVSVYDSTGVMVEPQCITIVDANNITVCFGTTLAGKLVVLR